MVNWLRKNASVAWSWAALIAIAAIVFGASRGTVLAQFGIGLLTAALALLVAMGIFELIWQGAMKGLDAAGGEQTPENTRKHRQRRQ
jgi:hypothetical protein